MTSTAVPGRPRMPGIVWPPLRNCWLPPMGVVLKLVIDGTVASRSAVLVVPVAVIWALETTSTGEPFGAAPRINVPVTTTSCSSFPVSPPELTLAFCAKAATVVADRTAVSAIFFTFCLPEKTLNHPVRNTRCKVPNQRRRCDRCGIRCGGIAGCVWRLQAPLRFSPEACFLFPDYFPQIGTAVCYTSGCFPQFFLITPRPSLAYFGTLYYILKILQYPFCAVRASAFPAVSGRL